MTQLLDRCERCKTWFDEGTGPLCESCVDEERQDMETAQAALQSVYDHLDARGYRHDRELLSLLHRLERKIEAIKK